MAGYNYHRSVARAAKLDDHKKYLENNDWRQIRLHVLMRDNYTCIKCGKTNCKLIVHHKNYRRWSKENLNDLVTLCFDCHQSIHQSTF